jgi:DNA repair protein NreA
MFVQASKKQIDYRKYYALVEKLKIQEEFNQKAKKDFFGNAPDVFVGRFNYPHVQVGILNTEEYNEQADMPKKWSAENLGINDIVKIRAKLINSHFQSQIEQKTKERLLDISKEVSLSINAPDVEVNLQKAPQFNLSLDQDLTPYGPSIKVDRIRLANNAKIPDKVERVINDDLKAVEQVQLLYQKGFDEQYLTKILSMGNLGIHTNQKLVPTRWSITATDDMLGKQLIKDIKDNNYIEFSAFFGGYLGNYYLILCFPEVWNYELFEIEVANKKVWTDYEDVFGRKTYAEHTAGGYYAARLAILEMLKAQKKQASILALRFVTEEYFLPLGVWVVREATRKSASSKKEAFASKEYLINYAKAIAKKHFGLDIDFIIKQSKLLDTIGKQKKLFEY